MRGSGDDVSKMIIFGIQTLQFIGLLANAQPEESKEIENIETVDAEIVSSKINQP